MKTALKFSFLGLFICILAACEKPDPNPELKDALYLQYMDDSKTTEAEVKAAEGAVVTAKNDVKAAVPQTGQIRFAEKRLWEAQAKLDRAKQKFEGAKLRILVRLTEVREKYLISFYNKTPLQEITREELAQQRALASMDRSWSVSKRRSAIGLTTKSNKPGGEPAPPKPKPEGGGHH